MCLNFLRIRVLKERQVESVHTGIRDGDSICMSDWKILSSGSSSRVSPPLADLQL